MKGQLQIVFDPWKKLKIEYIYIKKELNEIKVFDNVVYVPHVYVCVYVPHVPPGWLTNATNYFKDTTWPVRRLMACVYKATVKKKSMEKQSVLYLYYIELYLFVVIQIECAFFGSWITYVLSRSRNFPTAFYSFFVCL